MTRERSDAVRKKNTGEPGNGGQFGSKQHTEAEAVLAPGAAVQLFTHLRCQAEEAREAMWVSAENALAESAIEANPAGSKVLFAWYANEDGGQLLFRGLVDRDDNTLPITDSQRLRFAELGVAFDDVKWVRESNKFEEVGYDEQDLWDVESGYFFDVEESARLDGLAEADADETRIEDAKVRAFENSIIRDGR